MPKPIEITRLEQAIEAFESRKPQGLPDGFEEALAEVKASLAGGEPANDSPGARSAREVGSTEGTGVHFSKAARGKDVPSPGQRSADAAAGGTPASLSDEFQRAALALREQSGLGSPGDG